MRLLFYSRSRQQRPLLPLGIEAPSASVLARGLHSALWLNLPVFAVGEAQNDISVDYPATPYGADRQEAHSLPALYHQGVF